LLPGRVTSPPPAGHRDGLLASDTAVRAGMPVVQLAGMSPVKAFPCRSSACKEDEVIMPSQFGCNEERRGDVTSKGGSQQVQRLQAGLKQ
jgi:hypothetical protein